MNDDNSKQADYCALLFSILAKHYSQQEAITKQNKSGDNAIMTRS